ncbi:MAG: signal peptidase II [Lachnospirales bacterium]
MGIVALVIVGVLILIDQLIKIWTLNVLKPIGEINVISNFFSLTYVENRGAAFGILQGGKWIFVIIAVVVICFGVYYFYKLIKNNGSKIMMSALILVGSGAIGNIIDRLYRGFVVDMLNFNIFGYDFPVFNFADICVCVGAALLIFDLLINDNKIE